MEIFTHTRCAAFAPRTHGLENMPGFSATQRSIEEIDGSPAEITETSGNILFFFSFFFDPVRMFFMILKKNWGYLFSKYAVSWREIAGGFHRAPALIENTILHNLVVR